MGCSGSKAVDAPAVFEGESKEAEELRQKIALAGSIFLHPVLSKTFQAWKQHVIARRVEKDEQRRLNEEIAKKNEARKLKAGVGASS